jgi:hypothetical protein
MTDEIKTQWDRSGPTEPKHLRVGVNVAMRDLASLTHLLVRKGVITELEYLTAIADGMEFERDKYSEELSRTLGANITLG